MPNSTITLSDEQLEQLAKLVSREMMAEAKREFYSDIGKGLWDIVKKGLLAAVLGLAIWGSVIAEKGMSNGG